MASLLGELSPDGRELAKSIIVTLSEKQKQQKKKTLMHRLG
jgi:hypothetical protein